MGPSASQLLPDRLVDHRSPLTLASPFERIASIDDLRVLAAIGIVWFHTDGAPYRNVGYAGLPVFLLIFFSLITSRSGAAKPLSFLKRRWDRLLKPWLFWSLLYGLFRLAKGASGGHFDSFRTMVSLQTVLAGTYIHLWYLPYAVISGFLVYELNRYTLRFNNAAVVFTATAIGLLILVVHAMGLSSHHLMCPVPQWEFGLAAIPLGFAIGRCLMVPSCWQQRLLLSTISFATLMTALLLIAFGHASSVIPYSLAVMLVCLAYCWRTNRTAILGTLAPLTFGIYLVHPLVSYGLRHWVLADQRCATFIGLTLCLSALLTLGIKQTPFRRFV